MLDLLLADVSGGMHSGMPSSYVFVEVICTNTKICKDFNFSVHVRAYEECVTGIQHAFVDSGIGTSVWGGGGGGSTGGTCPSIF